MTQLLAYAGGAPPAQLFGRSRSVVTSAGRRIRPTLTIALRISSEPIRLIAPCFLILSTNDGFAVDTQSASLVARSAISGGISTKR